MSCRDPFPFNSVAAAPPRSNNGDCANCAFLIAVIVFVTPGPAVTTATPIVFVILEVASAANTAEASSLTCTISIPSSSHPTKIGEICPPHKVKIVEMLFPLRKELIKKPACDSDAIDFQFSTDTICCSSGALSIDVYNLSSRRISKDFCTALSS